MIIFGIHRLFLIIFIYFTYHVRYLDSYNHGKRMQKAIPIVTPTLYLITINYV